MRRLILIPLLLSFGTLYAQDSDPDQALQNATTALQAAQDSYTAALKAKLAADKAKAAKPGATPAVTEPAKTKLYPIDTDLGVYGDGTVGIYYSYQGQQLTNYQQYKDIIDALGDAKSSKLIRSSQDDETLGWVGVGVGAGFFAFSVADLCSNGFSDSDQTSTTTNVIGVGTLAAGMGLTALGVFSFLDSVNDFDHAIRRYNKLVGKQDSVSFYLSPNPGQPELGLVQRF